MFSDFAIFRCNQFYFEEKYYLGKRVNVACFASQALFEQIWTCALLNNKNEYAIKHIFLNDKYHFNGEVADYYYNMRLLSSAFTYNHFINRIYNGTYSQNISLFLEYLTLHSLYYHQHPTSGIMLCAIAVSLGYKDIYIAGIDFYKGKEPYAFNALAKNLIKKDTNMASFIKQFANLTKDSNKGYHNKAFDLACLEFLAKHYGVNFYSICPNSPLSHYIPLAKTTNNNTFIPMLKAKDFIGDVCFPPNEAYIQFLSPINEKREDDRKHLKQNIYFRIFYDLLKLPSAIKHYKRAKR